MPAPHKKQLSPEEIKVQCEIDKLLESFDEISIEQNIDLQQMRSDLQYIKS